MTNQSAGAETDYLPTLYEDLYRKSAMNVDATIRIISKLEELSFGRTTADNLCCLNRDLLPGKPPQELIAEFKTFLATDSKPDLQNILELRNSLDRFQSL